MTRSSNLSLAIALATALFCLLLLAPACGSVAVSEPLAPAAADLASPTGFFSATQVERGRASYREACSECHKTSQFQGTDFDWRWRRQSAWDLYREISTNMPENKPGTLGAETYADVVAYLLSLNEYEVGSAELLGERESLVAIPLGAGVDKSRAP